MTHTERQATVNRTIKQKANEIRKHMENLDKQKEEAERELRDLQAMCAHAESVHHPRQIAEDDPWDECLICGAVF